MTIPQCEGPSWLIWLLSAIAAAITYYLGYV